MANTAQLIEAICKLIHTSQVPIPITLMNYDVEEVAAVIGGVVERCGRDRIALKQVFIDSELAAALGLSDGSVLEHGARPTIRYELGFGRQVRFERD
jgi:hypothetical protein